MNLYGARSPSWSAERWPQSPTWIICARRRRNGCRRRQCRAAFSLAAEKSFFVTRQYRAHLICILFIAWIVPPLIRFLVLDLCGRATTGKPVLLRRRCSSRARAGVHPRLVVLFRLWLLPDRRALAGRPVFPALAFGIAWLAWLSAPRATLARSILYCAAGPVLCSPQRRSADRSARYRHRCGRHPGDHRRRDCGDRRALPLGILLALGPLSYAVTRLSSITFIEFVRGVPLITVLFMASVMLPLFVPNDMRRISWCER